MMAERPTILDDLDNFPKELKVLPQWICWGWRETSPDQGNFTKVPVNPVTGVNMNDKDRANWMTFPEAVGVARSGGFGISGVAFCFGDEDPYCGVDLDDCRDPATGTIKVGAWETIRELDSYTEVSPSGTGVKIWIRGMPPRSGKRGGVEMYDHRRMFTATGWHLEGTPVTVRSAQKELLALSRRVWPEGETGPDHGIHDIPDPVSPALDDGQVLEKVRGSKSGAKFKRLWAGDLTDHDGDHSAADLALCGMLAFYTQDPVQIDRLFRQSKLMRPKWDERHRGDGANYGEMTVERSLVGRKPEDCWRGKEKATVTDGSRLRGTKDRPGIGERLLVGKAVAEGVEPPEMLVEGLIYEGLIHSWIAEGETGKSMLGLWASLRTAQGGRNVLYLDQEGSLKNTADRLDGLMRSCGGDAALLDRRFHYYQSPDVTLAEESLADLERVGREISPALVVFDSWADFLALEGLDENNSMDVTRWVTKVVYPLRDLGAAVLLLDHANKENKGKGGRGSTAKRNKMDASHKLIKAEDFDRAHIGRVRFTVDKDRHGAVERSVVFRVGGDGTGKIVCHREGDARIRMTDLSLNEQKVLQALDQGGLTSAEWKKAISDFPASSFHYTRKRLEDKGLVRKANDNRYYPVAENSAASGVKKFKP